VQGLLGCGAHSDYGVVSLLLVDGTPGFQIFRDGSWIDVDPIPGSRQVCARWRDSSGPCWSATTVSRRNLHDDTSCDAGTQQNPINSRVQQPRPRQYCCRPRLYCLCRRHGARQPGRHAGAMDQRQVQEHIAQGAPAVTAHVIHARSCFALPCEADDPDAQKLWQHV
jgi:hypothetical protein